MTKTLDHSGRELEEQLRFESLLSDLSARFVNLPADKVDSEITDAQRRICECLGLDLAVLWQWGVDTPGVFTLTHFYRTVDGPPISGQVQAESFPWTLRQVLAGRSVVISSMEDVPEGAECDRESWRHFGLKNVAIYPLSAGGASVFGVISFHDMAIARTWSQPLVKRLELVAQIFANALVRKRTEQAVLESEERLMLATSAAGMGLWVLNSSRTQFWVNAKTLELLGLPPGEALDVDRFISLVYPEDRERVRETMARAVVATEMSAVEYRIVRPDGQIRWMQSRGRPCATAGGEPARLMGVTSDITERKQAVKALKDSETRLASAVDVAGLGFYEVANGEDVTFLDSRAKALVGLSGDHALGGSALQFWMEHLVQDDRPRILDLHRKLNGGELDRITVEFRYSHPQRGPIWLQLLSHVTERDAAGHERRTIGVFRDITTQKTSEQESRETQNELAHAMRVSTMGELAASIAHELNQPLTAILSNAQAAQRLLTSGRPDLGEIREILADIAADDLRAGEVISRVRSLLKKNIVDRKVVDMNAVIREVLGLARMSAILKGVSLVSEVSTDPLPVLGDRIQLQQVLLNLVMNSFNAMQSVPAGGREVFVRSQRSDADGVLVSVRDTGIGIAAAVFPRIFEPFFTSNPGGMGMGLPICRSIIESHGGRIWAENSSDRGATFQFALPIAEERDEGAQEEGRGAWGEGKKR